MLNPDDALGGAAILSRIQSLTRREQEMLILTAHGHTHAAIAGRCGIDPSTVKNMLHSAYKKLGAKNGPHAVFLLMRGQQYAHRTEAGVDSGEGYRAALGAIREIINHLGPMQGELATLAHTLDQLASRRAA